MSTQFKAQTDLVSDLTVEVDPHDGVCLRISTNDEEITLHYKELKWLVQIAAAVLFVCMDNDEAQDIAEQQAES